MAQQQANLPLQISSELNSVEARDCRDSKYLASILSSSREKKKVTEPYTQNISSGKNTYVYDAHTYHTKVPPQGISLLIDYYTNPGEIVLDPFCGSGMTGVATLERGRRSILSDLSPAAVFIAENLCTPIDEALYMGEVNKLLSETEKLAEKLYKTTCRDCGRTTPLLYTVWSYGLICNKCEHEFVLWDVARDERETVKESKIKKEFDCPHCGQNIAKRSLKRTKRYPVQVGYKCCSKGNKEQTAPLNADDFTLLDEIEREWPKQKIWHPKDKFPTGVNTRQPIAAGVDSIDKAYTTRALWSMAALWEKANSHPNEGIRKKLLFTLTSLYQRVTVFSEFRFWGGSGNIANYNVPQIMNEQNVFLTFLRKAKTISWYFRDAPKIPRELHISVNSACDLTHIPEKSIDFIFTDPPFGSNINYSEMNFLWESWLQNHTDHTEEAIVSKPQGKSAIDYKVLLCRAFLESHRVLRDDGWMCVVFHNSSEAIWQALQGAITDSGFVVRSAQTFDKQHGTFKMFVSENAVGYDLVLHCQKKSENDPPASQFDKSKIDDFIRNRILSPENYQTHYLHVARNQEFDYRKLYAEWLCDTFSRSSIDIDFESFRKLVDKIRDEING